MNKLQNQPLSSMRPRRRQIQSFVSLVLRPGSDGIVPESGGTFEPHAKGITKSEGPWSRTVTRLQLGRCARSNLSRASSEATRSIVRCRRVRPAIA